MALVAKRRVTETWRDAIARRGREFGREQECLQAFDAHLADGIGDFEAAYRALEQRGLLWAVDEPQDPAADGPFESERASTV